MPAAEKNVRSIGLKLLRLGYIRLDLFFTFAIAYHYRYEWRFEVSD